MGSLVCSVQSTVLVKSEKCVLCSVHKEWIVCNVMCHTFCSVPLPCGVQWLIVWLVVAV